MLQFHHCFSALTAMPSFGHHIRLCTDQEIIGFTPRQFNFLFEKISVFYNNNLTLSSSPFCRFGLRRAQIVFTRNEDSRVEPNKPPFRDSSISNKRWKFQLVNKSSSQTNQYRISEKRNWNQPLRHCWSYLQYNSVIISEHTGQMCGGAAAGYVC